MTIKNPYISIPFNNQNGSGRKRGLRLLSVFAMAAFTLAGCMESQQQNSPIATTGSGDEQVVAVLTDPASEAVLPGSKAADWDEALGIFESVCVKTYPNMTAAKAAVSKLPFAVNPQTGTYYHKNLDLSIKLFEGRPKACSLVFGSRQDFLEVAIPFAAITGSGANIEIFETPRSAVTTGPNNSTFVIQPFGNDPKRNYYNAVLRPGE